MIQTRYLAGTSEKRRARDSNPQPASRRLISNQVANQFAYPPKWFYSKYLRHLQCGLNCRLYPRLYI
jgi:hypothetical protein